MRRLLAGFLAAGICITSLAGCELDEKVDSVSATVCGRIENIEGHTVTLSLGSWEDGQFVATGGQTVLTLPEDETQEKASAEAAEAGGKSASDSPFIVFGEGCTPVYANQLEVGDVIKVVLSTGVTDEKMEIRVDQLG